MMGLKPSEIYMVRSLVQRHVGQLITDDEGGKLAPEERRRIPTWVALASKLDAVWERALSFNMDDVPMVVNPYPRTPYDYDGD